MAIQVRRGPAAKFDTSKLLPGEWAVELDAKRVHMCFAAGDTRRMATYEEMKENIENCTEEIREQLIADVEDAGTSAAEAVLATKQDCFVSRIDLSGSEYSQDTYYPTTGTPIPKGGLHKIHVYTTFDMDAHPTWATNDAGYTCNMEVYDKAQSWGQTDGATISTDYSWKHSSQRPCGYVQMTHSSTPTAILRGGGIYYIETDYTTEWTVRTEAYTVSGDTVRPGNASKFDFDRATVFANINGNLTGNVTGNATSADKWKTGRYIDGALIDGTANRHHFGVCSTAGATAAKTCTIPGLAAADGARATVQFTNANTAANPTLNINGVGAFPIYWRGVALPGEYIYAGAILELQYITSNGAGRWCVVGDPTQVQLDNLRADVEGIEIGGRNLLRDSKRNISSAEYMLADYYLTEDLTEGEIVTISLKGAKGSDRSYFGMYNSGGTGLLGGLTTDDLGADGIYRKTFPWRKYPPNQFLRIYNMPSTATSASEIEWIKLERGNKATDWTPAPEDKTDVGHMHDDRYYTEAEINTKLAEKQAQIDLLKQSSETNYEDVSATNVVNNIWYKENEGYIKLVYGDTSGGDIVASLVPVSPGETYRITLTPNIYYMEDAYPLITAATDSSTTDVYEIIDDNLTVQGDGSGTYDLTVPERTQYLLINSAAAPIVKKMVKTATELAIPRKINGINFDGTADVISFGIEQNPEGAENKTASIPNFTLVDGARATILFGFGCLVDNATLNVSDTGAYPIMLDATTPLPNGLIDYGDIAEFVYYRSKWYMIGSTAWGRSLGGGR